MIQATYFPGFPSIGFDWTHVRGCNLEWSCQTKSVSQVAVLGRKCFANIFRRASGQNPWESGMTHMYYKKVLFIDSWWNDIVVVDSRWNRLSGQPQLLEILPNLLPAQIVLVDTKTKVFWSKVLDDSWPAISLAWTNPIHWQLAESVVVDNFNQ